MLRRHIAAAAALVLLASIGCDTPPPQLKPLKKIVEIPAANLPADMRLFNWTDRRGSGSCVIASSCYNFNWSDQEERAMDWRRRYAGGQTETTIRRKHDAEQIPYYFTRSADMEFLEWCNKTRRSALIWFFQSHCVNFVGISRDPSRPTDPTQYVWLCDNNRPMRYLRIPKAEFARRWAGYGGFGLTPAAAPLPPPLFDARS
ncbi:MAG: hypothetical protein AAF958_00850 [Planctomycetota bacterium]